MCVCVLCFGSFVRGIFNNRKMDLVDPADAVVGHES